MTARSRFTTLFILTLVGSLSGGLAAQGKKSKPPADVAGSFTMPGPHPCMSPTTSQSLGACGDDLGIYQADGDGTYVALNSNREMRTSLYGTRFITLDFAQPVANTALCGTQCFLNFAGQTVTTDVTAPLPETPWKAVMQTNVVDIAGNDVAGGLMSLQVNEQKRARFFFTFRDPSGRDFHWSLRYYPELYPGSDYAQVKRTGDCTWEIQSQGGHRGGLIAYGVNKGKDPSSKEGVFVMPFELTFTAPGCTQ
jgi:hypothetical protein